MNNNDIKKSVVNFMECWKLRDWNGFTKYIQPSYLLNIKPKAVIERFANLKNKVIDYSIIDFEPIKDMRADVIQDCILSITMKNLLVNRHITSIFLLRCICETDEGNPAPIKNGGHWSVNPASLREVKK